MTGVEALYGVFHTGRVRVALPLDELREVIMRPPEFSPLPVTADGLLGAVNLRHVVIPVLDLCQLAGYPQLDAETGRVIVIVAVGDQMFGLLAAEIEGVAKITDEALLETPVAGERPALFSHTFERLEDGAVVSLLDAAAISKLPGVPVVRDSSPRGSVIGLGEINGDSSRRTVLLLRCGPIGLCIDVGHVHSVIPQLTLHPSPLDGATCRGVVHLHDKAVPAVDPLMMLGLGTVPDDGNLRGLVLAMPRGLVVLTVSDIADIASVPVTDVLPLPPVGMRKDGFLTGVLRTGSGDQHLLLDGAALRADAELDALGSLGVAVPGKEPVATPASASVTARTGTERDDTEGRRVVPSVRKFLTYNVGMEAATPLGQITEILPYPQHAIVLDSGGALLGIFTHRKLSVPLLSLPVLLGVGGSPDPATARVLLVDAPGGELVGFVVPSLHAIEDSVWEESAPKEPAEPGALLQRGPLVKIGTEAQGRLLPNIDLSELVMAELVG
ncbi:chemotaxis protein CheW [Actinoplanes sp. N902-109]|uniref:chemotaxis protein CheW n=1 Tax=Actinoplanes sp. (strain N902-109) TaxID=649831 RepID=UPI000329535F|nr:chemotaxis protein CheW [Actinoplanes sp. N902-109]AGL21177.1 CheW protein [Actinoplanes sp. N902-109]